MYADWALPGRLCSYLPLEAMFGQLLPGRRPVLVPLDSICAKPGDWYGTDEFQGPRFDAADMDIPGVVVLHMPNPCKLPYRMIDGRRRLEKLCRAGRQEAWFHILTFAEVEPWIKDVRVVVQRDSNTRR